MALGTAALIGLGLASGVASGVAGGAGKSQKTGVNLAPASGREQGAYQLSDNEYSSLSSFLKSLEDPNTVTNYQGSTADLSQALKDASANGGLPSAADLAYGNKYASDIYAPEAERLKNSFVDQGQEYQRLAARLGRNGSDPILQAKLRTEQTRQSGDLSARMGATAAETSASLPEKRLGLLERRNNLLGNVFEQAKRNREYLASIGQQIGDSERKFRLDSAGRTVDQPGSGFNPAAAFGGFAGGIGAGLSMNAKMPGESEGVTPMGANVQQIGPWSGGYGAGSMSGGYSGGAYSQYPGYGVYKVRR